MPRGPMHPSFPAEGDCFYLLVHLLQCFTNQAVFWQEIPDPCNAVVIKGHMQHTDALEHVGLRNARERLPFTAFAVHMKEINPLPATSVRINA